MTRWLSAVIALVVTVAGTAVGQAGSNPHGATIGACATCHLPDAWKPVRIANTFRHAENVFPLDGAHQSATCASCHTSLDFSKASPKCASCHTDVHRGELGVSCERCHTTRSFVDQARLTRLHEETRFPLRGAHAATPCEGCHTPTAPGQPQFTNRPTACISCHKPDYDRAKTPPHASAGFPTNCTSCHTESAWRGAPFDHNSTQFPLTGVHQTTPCTTCHADGVYKGKATACASCHQQDYSKTKAPPHAAAAFSTTCATCHTTTAWMGAPFDHNTTQFPLTGGHKATACTSCHADGVYHGRPTTCVACHQTDFGKTTTPPHAAANFATTCATCHTTTTWQGAVFDHNTTQFPLTGGHRAGACTACHADGVYHGKPTTCVSCHQTDYSRTTTPPHAAAAFATTCTTCHNTAAWLGATFNHNTTQFPLTGGHQAVACSSCHANGIYVGKPTTCVSCHQTNYTATTTPPHAAASFATTCATCHTTASWLTATFDHNTGTTFPLTGSHQAVPCASCHADGVYRGKPTTCVSCHLSEYSKTTTPPHAASGYSTDCSTCHAATTWQAATFNHNTTQFPLAGAHITVPCASCHGDGVFKGKPTTCVSCHLSDYNKTNPSHNAAGYSTNCASCHSVAAWQSATFNHNTTQFPLTGVHTTTPCSSCHADNVFKGKPTACASCHTPEYGRTTTPPHAAAGFANTCATCHTTTSWLTATFDHNTGTTFPLTGAHIAVACASCHANGVYKGKPTTCISCHQTDYNGTNNPGHAAAGYSTDCTTCHTTTTWAGAAFNHNTGTTFPLTGAHVPLTCNSCHADGVFKGKPTTCVSCHQPEYGRTASPPHVAAGFANTCATCHTTTSWLTATFNHTTATTFPLTGAHLAVACSACHGDGIYKGKLTTCVSCHQTEYANTKTPPHMAAGFANTCATCHSTTSWLTATFNHTTGTTFPLTGVHTTTPCASCHGDGVYKGKSTLCASCHTPEYNSTTNPNHKAAFFPTTCDACHTTATWLGATFDHDGKYFPIYSGAHNGRWSKCTDCHTSSTDFSVFTCTTCHTQSATNPHHTGVSGYSYQSARCYACHPKGRAG